VRPPIKQQQPKNVRDWLKSGDGV